MLCAADDELSPATSLALEAAPTTGTTVPMRVLVAEDNLVKGASGQAVQSFNIRFGFDKTAGLPI